MIRDLPLPPERVWRALRERDREAAVAEAVKHEEPVS